MPFLKLKNTSSVVLHGKRPGEEFQVEADEDGIALDPLWRNRLRDEATYKLGHVTIKGGSPTKIEQIADLPAPPAPAPEESVPSRVPARSKPRAAVSAADEPAQKE